MIIDPDMPDHWKTRMLVDLLGGDEMAPVYLIRLWGHCQNRKKSEFENLPPAGLKALCRFQGDSQAFDRAMQECGFITRDGNSVAVCGWDEHNSTLVAAWENGKRGGRPRKAKKNPEETQQKPSNNPEKTEEKPSKNPAETQLEPDPNPQETDREEKIREEKNREDGETSTSAYSDDENFAMHTGWLPDDNFFTQMQMAGIPEDVHSLGALGEFKSHWMTEPDRKYTHAKWQHKYLQNLQLRRQTHGDTSRKADGRGGSSSGLSAADRIRRANQSPATADHQ